MQVEKFHYINLQPMRATYAPDSEIKFASVDEFTHEGIDLIFPIALSGLESTTTNNYTNLYLSERKNSSDIFKSDTLKPLYPIYRSTHIRTIDTDKFWVTSSTGTTQVSGISSLADNRYYYELEIVSPSHLAVRQFDGNSTLKYLTLTPSNSSSLTFETRNEEVSGAEYDGQLFNYILDESGKLSLFNAMVSANGNIRATHQPSVIKVDSNNLKASTISSNWSANNSETFLIRPLKFAPKTLNLTSTWNSYVSSIESNTLDVEKSRSLEGIANNYIIHTATNDLSGDMKSNMFPLKNQLTVDGRQSRNNPYHSAEKEVDHRNYHTLHTGTKQLIGYDSIGLNYTTGSVDVTFPVNELTYFNLPPTITPYKSLHIDDAKLPEAGAIWSGAPATSDKVFKKLAARDGSNILDEEDGTFLCAWLSGNSDPNIYPVWVDRYYNPNFITQTQALTSGVILTRQYNSKFDSVTEKLSATSSYVYDKRSDLVFEPNALYAYYHAGNSDNEKLVHYLRDYIVTDKITKYVDYQGTPVHVQQHTGGDQGTHKMPAGGIMTGDHHNPNSVTAPLIYTFNRDNYGVVPVDGVTGSFTLSFWIYNSDWSKPFTNQIIGTYTTNGFGLFNESFITPFILIPDGSNFHLFNSNYDYITTHYTGVNIRCYVKKGSTENYWVVDDSNIIYEYDMNGAIQNKIDTSSLLSGKTVTDIEIDDQYIYLALHNSAQYYRYDLSNQSSSYYGELINAHWWNAGVISTTSSNITGVNIHSTLTGLSSDGNRSVILTAPDKNVTQGSVVDNYGNPWVIQNNILYTYDISVSAAIPAVSGTNGQIVEAVNCDRDGNIWVLHNSTNVTKLTPNRDVVFTTTLSSTPTGSSRYIDFVYEFGSAGYIGYATILNQASLGAKSINVNLDGTFRSEFSVLTGDLKTGNEIVTTFKTPASSSGNTFYSWKTTTGFDYMRRYQNSTVPKLDAKIALTNLYNSSTTTAAYSGFNLSYDLTGLKRGWHHVGVVLDSELGNYEMYIDSIKVDSITLPAAKFSYSDVFNQPLIVGATPFYNNILLSEAIKQPRQYLATNIQIKDFKVYNTALSYFDLKSHYLVYNKIDSVEWQIPVGERSYVDTIERVFKHKLPGRKSEMYNVNIRGLDVSDSKLKNELQQVAINEIKGTSPMYTKVNKATWNSNETMPLSSVATSSVPVVAQSQKTTSTTRVYGSY